ncbi:MAG: MBL fold metallo-hydrolase [Chloroflexi bacterium]|nr:MBL fold metallo-hydrolase [Chloroflexota bacterium]
MVVKDGDILPYLGGIQVIHTPGHTPGSISLYIPKNRMLFVGDTIVNNVNRLSRPLPLRSNRDEAERSLKRLAELDMDIVCFGHGPPLDSAKESISQLALRYPKAPVWWRIIRNWQRLIRFTIGLFRRSKNKEKP